MQCFSRLCADHIVLYSQRIDVKNIAIRSPLNQTLYSLCIRLHFFFVATERFSAAQHIGPLLRHGKKDPLLFNRPFHCATERPFLNKWLKNRPIIFSYKLPCLPGKPFISSTNQKTAQRVPSTSDFQIVPSSNSRTDQFRPSRALVSAWESVLALLRLFLLLPLPDASIQRKTFTSLAICRMNVVIGT